jgi:hypothetical protein
LTARQTIARPYKIWLLVLVCTIAIATADDSWSIATSANSELLIVTDDDDTDDSAERMPACLLGRVGRASLRSFVRKRIEVTGPAEPRTGLTLRFVPRGPPRDRSNQRARTDSSCAWPSAADLSLVATFPVATIPHRPSLQPAANFSRNQISEENS